MNILMRNCICLWWRLWFSQYFPLLSLVSIDDIIVLIACSSISCHRLLWFLGWRVGSWIAFFVNYFAEVDTLRSSTSRVRLLWVYIYSCFGTVHVVDMLRVSSFNRLGIDLNFAEGKHVGSSNTCKSLECIFIVTKGSSSFIELIKWRIVWWTASAHYLLPIEVAYPHHGSFRVYMVAKVESSISQTWALRLRNANPIDYCASYILF